MPLVFPSHEMELPMQARINLSFLSFHCLVVAAFLLTTEVVATSGELAPERRIPTTWKLDIRQVALVVVTKPEYTKRLHERAAKKFKEAGLKIGEHLESSREPAATLVLTLEPNSLESICPGKFLYDRKLEIEEYVIPERNDKLRVRALTWSLIGGPTVTGDLTIEQLETDLDEYIYQFIIAYKFGNPREAK